MKERPILFSAPMVRALLAGTKTQTRRAVVPQPQMVAEKSIQPWNGEPAALLRMLTQSGRTCRYGQPGDRLWVRETWSAPHKYDDRRPSHIPALARWHYAATEDRGGLLWRPSIHMPRCASRITLEVTSVRVERLQDISEADALAEGIVHTHGGYGLPAGEHFHAADPRESYLSLWEAINGAGSVQANPWVWTVQFKRVTP
jgi:hypothetical protein